MLDKLVDQLAPKLDELREQGRLQQRGGERIRARGAGAKDKLTVTERVLATVLYLRKLGTRDLLAQLFGVNGSTLTRAARRVQPPVMIECSTVTRALSGPRRAAGRL